MQLTTTLKLLRAHTACKPRYDFLVAALGPEWADDAALPLLSILDSNGLDDALWALRATPPEQEADRDRIARIYACDCAERVFPIWRGWADENTPEIALVPEQTVAIARRYAIGEATSEELAAAGDAAWAAALAAEHLACADDIRKLMRTARYKRAGRNKS